MYHESTADNRRMSLVVDTSTLAVVVLVLFVHWLAKINLTAMIQNDGRKWMQPLLDFRIELDAE